jgi:hypothetical protein
MAQHGLGDGGIAAAGVQMAMGAAIGNAVVGGQQQRGVAAPPNFPVAPAPVAGGGTMTCSKCGTAQPAGKFCAECGTALVVQKKFCTGCGGELGASAKFCANCGTSAVAAG